MEELFNIFNNLVFPIAVCVALFYIVFKQNNEMRKTIENNTKVINDLTLLLKLKLNEK